MVLAALHFPACLTRSSTRPSTSTPPVPLQSPPPPLTHHRIAFRYHGTIMDEPHCSPHRYRCALVARARR